MYVGATAQPPSVHPGQAITSPIDIMAPRYRLADVSGMVSMVPAEKLVEALKGKEYTAYAAEAFLEARRATATAEEQVLLSSCMVGIHQCHPLRHLRERIRTNALSGIAPTEVSTLWLWGATATTGPLLYAQAGALMRSEWLEAHVKDNPEVYGQNDAADLIELWALASGMKHKNTRAALCRAVDHHYLDRRPLQDFMNLDFEAVQLAKSLAGQNAKLAVVLFRCLQRAAAWSHRGRVRWRSAWLRGAKASPDAIPGASTYGGVLTQMLQEHVFFRVKGHSAGKMAATYRFSVQLKPGPYDIHHVAAQLGVALDTEQAAGK